MVATIEVCIVAQDVNQLNKEYTKDNSIGSNCHIHIYFTPNLDSGGATAESISKNLGKQTIKTVSHSDGGGLGKGSDSESFTGRELMTADEVSHMSSERELVFVAGHRPIYGNKLRSYLQPFFLDRLKKYQEIYAKEHGYEEECKKFTKNGKHDCGKCVKESGKVHTKCPTYPMYSDKVTQVLTYADLFQVHEADKKALAEKTAAISEEKNPVATIFGKAKSKVKEQEKIKLEEEKAILEELSAESNAEIIACIDEYIVDADLAAEVEIEIAKKIAAKEAEIENAKKIAKEKAEMEKIQAEKAQKVLGNLEKVEEQNSQFGRVSADRLSGIEMGEGFDMTQMIKQAMQYRKDKEEREMKAAAEMPVDESLFESAGGQDESKNTVEGTDTGGENKKTG